jgi:3-methyladenine DNA glycosylase/8-oxoguanine DNA glycosylase
MVFQHAARTIQLDRPLDLRLTLSALRRGGGDPTIRVRGSGVWRATRTPLGPATQHLTIERTGAHGRLHVEAWGPGAEWLLERAPSLAGEADDDKCFKPHPQHHLLRDLWRLHPGLRIPRSEAVFEASVGSILEQVVPGAEASRGWRTLVRRLSEQAPGSFPGLFLPPDPVRLAATPYYILHTFGIERRRADTIRRAAAHAPRLEEATGMSLGDARLRLRSLPGMGHWTAAEVALVALGDADAVSVGDYHLPHVVAWALAGERKGTDEMMLELLEPYRGHRGRVIRLLTVSGVGPPRRGPRLALRDVARM